jgi:hypothetical protein
MGHVLFLSSLLTSKNMEEANPSGKVTYYGDKAGGITLMPLPGS